MQIIHFILDKKQKKIEMTYSVSSGTLNTTIPSRQNSGTFDILHSFLSSVVAKLCDLK